MGTDEDSSSSCGPRIRPRRTPRGRPTRTSTADPRQPDYEGDAGNLAKRLQACYPGGTTAMRLQGFVGLGTSDKVVVRVPRPRQGGYTAIAAAYQKLPCTSDSIYGVRHHKRLACLCPCSTRRGPDAPSNPRASKEGAAAGRRTEPATPPAGPPASTPPPPVPVYQPTAVAQPGAAATTTLLFRTWASTA